MSKTCCCGNKQLMDYSETYYVCNECHTLVSKENTGIEVYDVTSEDNDLYGSNYWKKSMVDMTGESSLDGVVDYYLKERVVYWIKYILKYVPLGSSVAEIGCGLGQLAYLMKTIGYKQVAFELSPEICDYIRTNLKVNIYCGEFGGTNEVFDAIIAFDLFEHIANPKELLEKIANSLTEQGVLCIQMPNFDYNLSYQEMRKKKPRFEGLLNEKEHLFLYSKESILNLLKQAGFQDVIFEPACFGDDYDMFFFAGKGKLNPITQEQIEKSLDKVNAGRIVKALCKLYAEKRELEEKIVNVEADSIVRLENNKTLEANLIECENDRAERLKVIESCNERLIEQEKVIENCNRRLAEQEKNLIECENDRAERLKVIESCNERLIEQEKVIENYNQRLEEQGKIIEDYRLRFIEKEKEISKLYDLNKLLIEKNNGLGSILDAYQAELGIKKR